MAVRGITSTEKLLLLALANFANEQMECFPSQKRLAEDTCMTDRTVRAAFRSLEDKGLVERSERRRADGYRASDRIVLHLFTVSEDGISPEAFSPEIISPEICVNSHRKNASISPEGDSAPTTLEPSGNRNRNLDVINARERSSKELHAEAVEAADGAADLTVPGMHHVRDLLALVEPASGEPCEWGEVLDAIRMVAFRQRKRGKTIRSWSWVAEDALALRDRRLAGLPDPVIVQFSQPTGPPMTAWERQEADRAEGTRIAIERLTR